MRKSNGNRRSRTRRTGSGNRAPAGLSRRQSVLGAFVAMMGAGGGLLWLMQGGPTPRHDGMVIPSLISAVRSNSIEAVFDAVPAPKYSQWSGIQIHRSGGSYGTPESVRSQAGVPGDYHFVIGNGAGMENGTLHVGYRWIEQSQCPGGGTAIHVCVVGDGNRRAYTDAQIGRLLELTAALADRCSIDYAGVGLGTDAEGMGRFFPLASFQEQLSVIDR